MARQIERSGVLEMGIPDFDLADNTRAMPAFIAAPETPNAAADFNQSRREDCRSCIGLRCPISAKCIWATVRISKQVNEEFLAVQRV